MTDRVVAENVSYRESGRRNVRSEREIGMERLMEKENREVRVDVCDELMTCGACLRASAKRR